MTVRLDFNIIVIYCQFRISFQMFENIKVFNDSRKVDGLLSYFVLLIL